MRSNFQSNCDQSKKQNSLLKIILLSFSLLLSSFSGCIDSGANNENDPAAIADSSSDEDSETLLGELNNTTQEPPEKDFDSDGVADIEDLDDDNDGVIDLEDEFPLDDGESLDSDKDGIGNNADLDDDGDGWDDETEALCGSDPIDGSIFPADRDGDLLCDSLDADFSSAMDQFQFLGPNRDFPIFAGLDREGYALNIITWQMEHGGWEKWNEDEYQMPWDGNASRSFYKSNGVELGSLADQATTGEIRYLSSIYANSTSLSNKSALKDSVELGVKFILDAQHLSGGWPQVFPNRTCNGCNYTSLMTYNDFVIPNALLIMHDIKERTEPFDTDITSNINFTRVNSSIISGIDYVLNSQVVVNGTPTIWGQQHHPTTFESLPGRSYELACRASGESAGVTLLLLNWKDRTPEIDNATWWAVQWFENNLISDLAFDQQNGTIVESQGAVMWFRYYNVSDDQFFMAGRDGIKVYDLSDLTEERRTGYRWAFDWAGEIISESAKVPTEKRTMT
jgi:PelA/Pel-15E family pectate lyase